MWKGCPLITTTLKKFDGEPYTTSESQHGSALLRDDGLSLTNDTYLSIAGTRSSVVLPLELASSEATNSGFADVANIDLGTLTLTFLDSQQS